MARDPVFIAPKRELAGRGHCTSCTNITARFSFPESCISFPLFGSLVTRKLTGDKEKFFLRAESKNNWFLG